MGSNLASIDALLKEVYEGTVNEQLNNEVVALKRIQRSADGVTSEGTPGKYVVFPIHTRRNGGLGSRNEGEALPKAGQQGYAAARLALKSDYMGIEITGHSIDQSSSNPKAFAKSLEEEMDRAKDDYKKDLNRQIYGNGSGAIATVRAAGTGVNIVPVDNARGFWLGAHVVDIVTAPSTVAVPGRTVTAIDLTPGANTITLSGAVFNVAVGQIITLQGSVNREITGLASIVSNTGVLYNINPNTEPVWKAEVDSNGGTGRAVSEGLMVRMTDRIRANGGKTTVILTDDGTYRAYWSLLSQLRSFVNTQDFSGGFKGLAFQAGDQEIPIVSDYDAPRGTMHFLNEKDLTFYRDKDLHWLDRDGSVLKQKVDANGRYDIWEAHMLERHELGAHRRNTHGKITDLISG